MINKLDLYQYLLYKENNISPIRVQKLMFYCYAYWFSLNKSTIDEELFIPNFEAWRYGPVEIDIYLYSKKFEEKDNYNFSLPKNVEKFVDFIYEEFSGISDFGIVELSHRENCWKKNFNHNDFFHNKKINNQDIFDSFSNRPLR